MLRHAVALQIAASRSEHQALMQRIEALERGRYVLW
jgi:hypothetical protein